MSREKREGVWWEAFFAALARTADVCLSAELAGVRRSVVYYHRDTNPTFKTRWVMALEQNRDRRTQRAKYHASLR